MRTQMDCNDAVEFLEDGLPMTYQFGESVVTAKRCSECGYIFFPSPDPQVLIDYYRRDYAQESATWYTPELDYRPQHCNYRMGQILSLAAKFGIKGKLATHECGCSFGGTVHTLRMNGHDATGTEFNPESVRQARLRGNEWIFSEEEAAFLNRNNRKIDVFYGYHSFEHMPEPSTFLRKIRSYLTDRSIAIFFVPNAMFRPAIEYNYASYDWYAYPGHLHMFSPRSLLCLAESANFVLMDIESNQKEGVRTSSQTARRIPSGMLQQDWLGKELGFVLAPADSSLPSQYRNHVSSVRDLCLAHGLAEKRMMDRIAESPSSRGSPVNHRLGVPR